MAVGPLTPRIIWRWGDFGTAVIQRSKLSAGRASAGRATGHIMDAITHSNRHTDAFRSVYM